MKLARVFAVLLGILGLLLMLGTAVLCFGSLDASVRAEIPREVEECAAEVAELLSEGELDALAQKLYGNPRLGTDTAMSEEAALVWEIFRKGISCELVSECYVSGSSFAVDAVITVPEIASVTDTVKSHAKTLLEERIAGAEKMAELYDENGNFHRELIDEVMDRAVELAFAEDVEKLTFETTMGFVWQGEQWYVVPDGNLLRSLQGGLD